MDSVVGTLLPESLLNQGSSTMLGSSYKFFSVKFEEIIYENMTTSC